MKKNKFREIIFLLFSITSLNAQVEKMHITEQLLNGTIRIESTKEKQVSTGTGFFFSFTIENKSLPVIITNKHVVEGFPTINLYFKEAINGNPDYGPAYIVTIPNNSKTVLNHPNNNVDLVAIPIGNILNEVKKNNVDLFYISIDEDRIPSDSIQTKELKAIENIWMIGYPNGLWDKQNNLPIVREGITATAPYFDYNGKREFLVDIAAFGGSSGSPIFYYRDFYTNKETYRAMIGVELYLLGILYAGPMYSIDGKVIKVSPTDPESNVKSNIPMNLGIVIKASEILAFKTILLSLVKP